MTVGISLLLLSALAAAGAPSTGGDLNPANCAGAAAYSRRHGGEVLRVEQAGRLVYEDTAPGCSADAPRKIYSGTKSFIAVTAMILLQRGELRLDERASDTLTEWRHDARRTITIDQLLSQTSGLDPDGDSIYSAHDQLAAAVRVPLVSPPGARFHYGAAGYQAFGEILRRKFGKDGKTVEDIVNDTLLDPYDLDVASWKRDDAGNVLIHAGMQMTAKAWARFGELLLRSARTTDDVGHALGFPQLFQGHAANPAYGLGFWLNAPQPPDARQPIVDLQPAIDGDQLYPGGPPDLIAAIGTGKQRLYVIPSLRLVIVRFGHDAPFSDGDFLSRLLTGHPHPDARTH
jgi:CubicO group peptidase (beta-lactamase class C family)